MAKKSPEEEAAIKRSQELSRKEAETERRINEQNKKTKDAEERLRNLLKDEDDE